PGLGGEAARNGLQGAEAVRALDERPRAVQLFVQGRVIQGDGGSLRQRGQQAEVLVGVQVMVGPCPQVAATDKAVFVYEGNADLSPHARSAADDRSDCIVLSRMFQLL